MTERRWSAARWGRMDGMSNDDAVTTAPAPPVRSPG